MYRSQQLAFRYFTAAMVLFGIMIVAGLIAASQYLQAGLFYGTLDFNVVKTLHIDTMILWLLMGFMGAVYWFLPGELEREVEGIGLAQAMFWIFCVAVAVVAAVFVLVQYGPSNETTLWLINQGRKYVEAPRWAAAGITVIVLVFIYNVVATALRARRVTGVLGVLLADLVPLAGLYLIAFPAITDMSEDLFWWWWLVHLWVEATWEILIGAIMALALMQLLGTSRRIVETWLYVEVALVLGTGILGLGHHYFWIGTPSYWLAIGGFFSALEPLPLLGMVVHAVYDAGVHQMKTSNKPAFWWMLAEAFGNFIGAGVWGFMMTLPQINLFTHGTQWTVSHGHFAFWGAYACGVISVIYLALQKSRGKALLDGRAWKWSFGLLNVGIVGMAGALLVAGIAQAFFERAIGGSTLYAFIDAQTNRWFVQGIAMRLVFGFVFAAGYVVLIWDLLTIGRRAPAVAARAAGAAA